MEGTRQLSPRQSKQVVISIVDPHCLADPVLVQSLRQLADDVHIRVFGPLEQIADTPLSCDELETRIAFVVVSCRRADSLHDAQTICRDHPDWRVIFVANRVCDTVIQAALSVKARGLLTTDAGPRLLESAVREVESGGVFFCRVNSRLLIVDPGGARLPPPSTDPDRPPTAQSGSDRPPQRNENR